MKYEDAAEKKMVEGWVCKKCGRFWGKDEVIARSCCCTDRPCNCGARIISETSVYRTRCDDCEKNWRDEAWEEAISKAKLCDWDGNPFVIRDKFYRGLCDLDETSQAEEFAMMATRVTPDISYDEIIRNILEQAEVDEPSEIDFDGEEEFRAAVEKFARKNQSINWYIEDSTRKFKLPKGELI